MENHPAGGYSSHSEIDGLAEPIERLLVHGSFLNDMPMSKLPDACRPQAYELFAEQLPIIETTAGLLNAAIAISMHALDDVEPGAIDEQLQDLVHRVSSRVRSQSSEAMLAHFTTCYLMKKAFKVTARTTTIR